MKILSIFFVFVGSHTVALNLATMYPNPDYAASWFKVAFALILSCFGMLHLALIKESTQ